MKLLELIIESGKFSGYTSNTEKSVALLCINSHKLEGQIGGNNSIYHYIKKNKTPKNKPKEAKHLYSKDYETLKKNGKMTDQVEK